MNPERRDITIITDIGWRITAVLVTAHPINSIAINVKGLVSSA